MQTVQALCLGPAAEITSLQLYNQGLSRKPETNFSWIEMVKHVSCVM